MAFLIFAQQSMGDSVTRIVQRQSTVPDPRHPQTGGAATPTFNDWQVATPTGLQRAQFRLQLNAALQSVHQPCHPCANTRAKD